MVGREFVSKWLINTYSAAAWLDYKKNTYNFMTLLCRTFHGLVVYDSWLFSAYFTKNIRLRWR